ncbi:MAG: hypothetical protein HC833_08155 [Leptolyngbyaceae cyanobacterium RM1_406_9]|nr:hypothetical protein [Leptolyngbyaceae cyanobacterium RM1_406_9]
MASISAPNFANPYAARTICRIVGFTCLAGFLFDFLLLALPPSLGDLEWRVGFMQQIGDRSIILLFGAALTLFGSLDSRQWLKQLAMGCLIVGVVFHLSCILLLRDSMVLQQQAIANISTQAAELQTQLEASESDPAAAEVSPEERQQVSQLLTSRAETLRQNARTGILKAGLSTIGNLVVIGLGLISLGRYGMRQR